MTLTVTTSIAPVTIIAGEIVITKLIHTLVATGRIDILVRAIGGVEEDELTLILGVNNQVTVKSSIGPDTFILVDELDFVMDHEGDYLLLNHNGIEWVEAGRYSK